MWSELLHFAFWGVFSLRLSLRLLSLSFHQAVSSLRFLLFWLWRSSFFWLLRLSWWLHPSSLKLKEGELLSLSPRYSRVLHLRRSQRIPPHWWRWHKSLVSYSPYWLSITPFPWLERCTYQSRWTRLTRFISLYFPYQRHSLYSQRRGVSQVSAYQSGFKELFTQYQVSMFYENRPLLCSHSFPDLFVFDFTEVCVPEGESVSVRVKVGAYFSIRSPASLAISNLILDFSDSLSKWESTCSSDRFPSCSLSFDKHSHYLSVESLSPECECSHPLRYVDTCFFHHPLSLINTLP